MSTIEKALQKNKMQPKDDTAGQVNADKSVIEQAVESRVESKVADKPATASVPVDPAPREEIQTDVSTRDEESAGPRKLSLEKINLGFVNNLQRNAINEEFRAIKRKVLSNAFGPLSKTLTNSNIIMVSSPNPNEGKTFTALNLALSIALEQDKTVLLVDADVLRPSIMKTIGQPFENGLMEYLLGEVDDLSEIIHHTDIPTLRIIPAGKSHHLSTELLASQKMLETVNEFSTRYSDRVVIFDTPPLLGINETAILANLAGQAVVVVQEGRTSLTSLSQAVDHLNPDMAKGFVMNKAKKSSGDSAGYYGYYYGAEED